MVEGARAQATPSARILSPPRVAHNRGAHQASPPPHQSGSLRSLRPPQPPSLTWAGFRLESSAPWGWTLFLSHCEQRTWLHNNEVDEAWCKYNTRVKADLGALRRGTLPARPVPQPVGTVTWGSRAPSGGNLVMMYRPQRTPPPASTLQQSGLP